MSGRISKNRRTKSSKIICEERYCCDGENEEALFECEECHTKQCQSCEAKLHIIPKYEAHDRKRIESPPVEKLCQVSCKDKNFIDVRCKNCELNFCHDCFDKMHAHGRRKTHERTSVNARAINIILNQQTVTLTTPIANVNNAGNCAQTSSVDKIEAIKPLSPIEDDDSLTYLSMPHDQNQRLFEDDTSTLTPSEFQFGPQLQTGNPDLDACFAMNGHTISTPAPGAPGAGVRDGNPWKDRDSNELNADDDDDLNIMAQLSLDDDFGGRNISNDEIYGECKSFLLADQNEKIQVLGEDDFLAHLKCDVDTPVKVVSIFGNTGDGKSHTLNHTFFGGREVFTTSPNQLSCTAGVWAAQDPVHNAVIIDTEGLLGVSTNRNQRTRLLLKVLAISDIIIYRTRADRLHNDMFMFLGDASKAYQRHFTQELRAASKRCHMDQPLSTLGPAVIIFHETVHTEVLGKDSPTETAEKILRERFAGLELTIEAFSSLQYIGTRTNKQLTDFRGLLLAVKMQLRNNNVRSPRKPKVIFNALQFLNQKFNGDIEKSVPCTFPDQYFTCNIRCLSCGIRCGRTMNHLQDDEPHETDSRCKYQHQYENKIFTCKACYDQGKLVVVVPKTSGSRENTWLGLAKYAWAGYVLECPNCGIIFRSRQFWYGNQDPERTAVRTEIRHVWPGGSTVLQGTHNAARRLLDSLNYASQTVADLSAKPAKYVGNWVADQIAPSYWVPNAQIRHCQECHLVFTESVQIHHCRACGQGFCDECSLQKRPVPERGWGLDPVRVCDPCATQPPRQLGQDGDLQLRYSTHHEELDSLPDTAADVCEYLQPKAQANSRQLRARRVGEAISSTIGVVASAVEYPRVTIDTKQHRNGYTENTRTFASNQYVFYWDYGTPCKKTSQFILSKMHMLLESARPTYWRPDQQILSCIVCKADFNLKLSKHHCRSCGEGVCDPCSAERRPVSSRGWDHPVRVCKTCAGKADPL